MFEQGEIGSAIVVFKVHENWKAVVVHGHDEVSEVWNMEEDE